MRPLAITSCGLVSAAGLGLAALDHPEPAPRPEADLPPRPMRLVPEFSLADHIGKRGTKHLDRMTAFGLVAAKLALADDGAEENGARTGVVLATSTGSVRSLAAIARDTLVQDKPYQVNPAHFPNTVMNSCAGQIAIWHGLRGVNATLAGGQVSSLFAFRYARTAIGQRLADRLLVGGVEEASPAVAWAWHKSGALRADTAVGEGCALVAVEDAERAAERGRPILAHLLACEVGYHHGGDRTSMAGALASRVERALSRSGVRPDEVDVVSLGAHNHVGLDRIEQRAVLAALGRQPRVLRIADRLGETYSASGMMQLVALLREWARGGADRVALIPSVGRDGNLGCLVVRRPA
ncbi:beta-ketoacyl synthase N-terminal-like domain-containing protein [Kutzneria buriramensis]|uniref:3-oxoacyl-[acyl-carrier-protein] synthase II n=1 Tax=Kutzneria buriramensis TaxID=1045776 RepID=A0A3E0HKY8_9PSEU|nr:beta-ketoacyl synthase N-terminal-like domain-containing protein [Kutzneria buriramensis]REH47028.1 3-oxoacyl-[acyl-carrier-protein] synthase II [Kutzneria buriramensis]